MNRRHRPLALLALAVASGCTSSPTPAVTGASHVVPADLRDVERDGEGLVSTTFGALPARTPDWTRARTVLGLLRTVWTRLLAAGLPLPVAQSQRVTQAIAALDAAIIAQDQGAAVRAANEVGLACPELFDAFHPDAPIEIIRMDAVFRQVGIDAHFGDWPAVARDLASLHADWTSALAAVHGRVPTCHRVAGTATVEGDIDASLANLDRIVPGHDTAGTEQESENGALEIDTLELLFDCPPDGPRPTSGLGSMCRAASDCGADLACDLANAGGRCAPDPAHAAIGTPCTSTVECGTDSRSACNTAAGDSYPGGYCFMEPCNDVEVCPSGSTCVAIGGESPGCYRTCATDADCRVSDGYVCQLVVTQPPYGFGPSDHACAFRCARDSDCGSPLTCDVSSGRCRP
jgi:hypothetical protein